jgi:hypothetical protein
MRSLQRCNEPELTKAKTAYWRKQAYYVGYNNGSMLDLRNRARADPNYDQINELLIDDYVRGHNKRVREVQRGRRLNTEDTKLLGQMGISEETDPRAFPRIRTDKHREDTRLLAQMGIRWDG